MAAMSLLFLWPNAQIFVTTQAGCPSPAIDETTRSVRLDSVLSLVLLRALLCKCSANT